MYEENNSPKLERTAVVFGVNSLSKNIPSHRDSSLLISDLILLIIGL